MNKIFSHSVSLIFTTSLLISQTGCMTPANTILNNTDAKSSSEATATVENSFLLTQKDSKGVVNPIVPEDIESFTINGQVIKSSEIQINKELFSVKDSTDTKGTSGTSVSFRRGRFTLETKPNPNISFKIKNTVNSVIIPNKDITKAKGNLRVEVSRDNSGEVTGFIGGTDKDGLIDNSQGVFSLDLGAKTFTVIQPEGNKTEYSFKDLNSGIDKEKKKEKSVKANEVKTLTENVVKPSPVAPFVGNWKYSLLGIKVGLTVRDSGSGKIGYSSSIENTTPTYKGSFSGIADYSTNSSVNSLDISSLINNKSIKGNIRLSGDNSLTLVLTSTDEKEVKTFVGMPVTLERDIQ